MAPPLRVAGATANADMGGLVVPAATSTPEELRDVRVALTSLFLRLTRFRIALVEVPRR